MHMSQLKGVAFYGTFGDCGSETLAEAFPNLRYRSHGWLTRLWPYRPHHGLIHRPHLGLPSERGSNTWALSRQTLPLRRNPALLAPQSPVPRQALSRGWLCLQLASSPKSSSSQLQGKPSLSSGSLG